MSGTLDSLTPRLDGATLVASQMGKSARLVTFANLTHVTLQDPNDSCPASVYRRFVLDPRGLAHENTACAPRVSPVHSVGSYPLLLADAVPATATRGDTAGRQALQAVSVALAAVGDEMSRWFELTGDTDRGLRGGQVSLATAGNVLRVSLRSVRWVTNATISGTASWNMASGLVTATLTVLPAGGTAVRLSARWRAFATASQPAVITGSQGSARLAAVCAAP
jgi:hypothetical protein